MRTFFPFVGSNIRCVIGNSLAVQRLGLHTFTAEGVGSIPGQGTKIPQALRPKNKKVTRAICCGDLWIGLLETPEVGSVSECEEEGLRD